MNALDTPRMLSPSERTNPRDGRVVWRPTQSIWRVSCFLVAVIGGFLTLRSDALLLALASFAITSCLGVSIGLHRLLVHRSFECSRSLEGALVYLGTVAGIGGPLSFLYTHELRDWSQRHESCHPYLSNQNPLWRDFIWQFFCELRLADPPRLQVEQRIATNRFYRFLERTWVLQQIPWALLFYALGGVSYLVWGIFVRITFSMIGLFLVAHLAHNSGARDWHVHGHAVQGYNVPYIGLLTMGESWHNNHHAFPGSAKLGLRASQCDPGWWVLCALRSLGLVWNIILPYHLAERPELARIDPPALMPKGNL